MTDAFQHQPHQQRLAPLDNEKDYFEMLDKEVELVRQLQIHTVITIHPASVFVFQLSVVNFQLMLITVAPLKNFNKSV